MASKTKDDNQNDLIGRVEARNITDEMKESYLDYAMSVIIARALPDVRDGLKPVHRRILYAMYEDGLRHNAKFRKSATVVGSTLGRYHPHGDMAVYDALVRMAQDFSLRYVLIDGQGNFGSVDDPSEFAAMRYTECRLSLLGQEMLQDIEKETVDFRPNYDGTRKEPVVLPSPLPQLLLNGSFGIAVGMATSIPPHNASEVIDAAVYLVDHPEATTEDLFNFVQGPDFPTGGTIYGKKNIISAYSQGKGSILIRGTAEIQERKKDHFYIIITEIPFQVQKSELIKQLAKLVEDKRIEGVRDIRDESDKEGMRIVLDLRKDAFPKKILNALYKYTDLQKTFYLNMLALVEGIQPRVLSLADVLSFYLKHKEEIIIRRTQFDLRKAKERAHILEGLMIALANIDKVIETIKKSANKQDAHKNLVKKFKLSDIQANAILEMKLQSLAKLERLNIEKELKELKAKIKELEYILKTPKKVKSIIKEELLAQKEKYGDKRKTKVVASNPGEIAQEDLIPSEEMIIILTKQGFIKRLKPSLYRLQKRGGKGVIGVETGEEDIVEQFVVANTLDRLLFFTDSGKVFQCFVWEIPEMSRNSKGRGILNFLDIARDEKIVNIAAYTSAEGKNLENYLVMATRNGTVKKTRLADFRNVRKNGLIAIKLQKDDVLKSAQFVKKGDEIILTTQKGQSIRFKESDIRAMGRTAAGVKGLSLRKGDSLVNMDIIREKDKKEGEKPKKRFLLLVTENGYAKRSEIKNFRLQKRGGSGIKALKITEKTGELIFSQIVSEEEKDLIVISQKGQIIKSSLGSISILSRMASGVKVMKLGRGDKVASAVCL